MLPIVLLELPYRPPFKDGGEFQMSIPEDLQMSDDRGRDGARLKG